MRLIDAPSDFRHLRPELPSWVPDWSDRGWERTSTSDTRGPPLEKRYYAAGTSDPSWSFSREGRSLQVCGKFVDVISVCKDPFCLGPRTATDDGGTINGRSIEELGQTYDTLRSWASVCTRCVKPPPSGETVGEAFCRTLAQDDMREGAELKRIKEAASAWFDMIMSDLPDLKGDRQVASHRAPTVDDAGIDQANSRKIAWPERWRQPAPALFHAEPGRSFHMWTFMWTHRRSFFTTVAGTMGTAPARVETSAAGKDNAVSLIEPGDRIAIVAGLEMPLIL